MNSNHEIIEYNKDLPVKLFCQRIGTVGKHWHRSLEILLVLSGNMDVLVENEHYFLKENDLLLINSNQVHETYSDDCILIALQLRLSKFRMEWLDAEAPFFLCNSALQGDNKNFDTIRSLIAKLIQQNTNTSSYIRLLSYSYACELIYELLAHFRTKPPAFPRTRKQMERLGDIIRYIEENYSNEITLNDLASKVFLSPSYLSHFFEKNMNISFLNYVTKIRIAHSIDYLLYTSKSIEEIAQVCGFSNPRSYASFFQREYKMLPSRFRKEKKENTNLTPSVNTGQESSYLTLEKYDVFSKLNTYLNQPPEALLTKETLRVPLGTFHIQTAKPFQNNALTFCSVGRAKEILYKNIQDMLTTQQKEIGFTYIKFHGIFDDALMVYREDANGKPVLNFNMVDEILDFLVSIRLRPLIQFSFMPKSLAKTPEDTFFTVPFIMSEPKDNTKWELLVTRFTEHVLYKYGLQEVSQWIFTFWNETLTGFPFDFKTEDTSFYLYELTAKAVRQVNPQLKFANTSFINSSTSTTKIKSFFEYVKEKNCEPDVYLFHFYPISESHFILSGMINKEKFMDYNYKNRTVLNNDPEAFGKYLDELNLLFPNRGDVPLYITEWNLSPSHRELLNDTCFAGVYFIRNILMNYDKVQGFGHWSLSDWIEELPFPAELFHGGVGHFTKSGIKKPAYYAYFFLSKLKDEIISMDDGYFITKERNKDNYSIILYHYCHFSDIYGRGFNFNFSPTDRYEIFNGAVNKELSFSLSGVADGEYRITEHIVNRRYGSCFDKWVEMGAAPLLNAEETDALKQLSHPLIKIKNHTVTKQLLDYEAVLEPHEIRLIQLSKKN